MTAMLPRWARQLASILAYSACSISMTLANKHLVSHLGFKSHILLLTLQSVAAVITQLVGFRAGMISDLNQPSLELAKKWLPVNVCFIAMLYTSFRALGVLSMPIVTIFKNLTNIAITAGAWYLFGERVGIMLLGALFIIVLGAVLAGFADLQDVSESDAIVEGADDGSEGDSLLERLNGYMWMMLNCFTTATYVLYLRAASDFKGMSRQDQAFYNNAMAIPMSLFLSLLMGEMPGALGAEQMTWPSFWVAVLFSGSVGFFLSLASLWCVGETGATTYSMVGALNKIPLAFIGLFLFDAQMKPSTIIFMTFGLVGGVIFAYVKAREAQEARAKEAAEQAEVEAARGRARSGDQALPAAGEGADQHQLLGGEGFQRGGAEGDSGLGVGGDLSGDRGTAIGETELAVRAGSASSRNGSPLGRRSPARAGTGSQGRGRPGRLEALRLHASRGGGGQYGEEGGTPTVVSSHGAGAPFAADGTAQEESADGGPGTSLDEATHETEAHRRSSIAHAGEAGL